MAGRKLGVWERVAAKLAFMVVEARHADANATQEDKERMAANLLRHAIEHEKNGSE